MKKKIAGILAIMMVGAVLVGCSSKKEEVKNVNPADITTKITENIEMRMVSPIEGEMLNDEFLLNSGDYEEASVLKGMINSGIETVAVVKAKDGKVDAVKESFEKFKEAKKGQQLYPGEPETIDAAQLKVVGNYVGFFIIPDYEEGAKNSEKAAAIFEEALK